MDDPTTSWSLIAHDYWPRLKPIVQKGLSVLASSVFFAWLPMFLTISYMSYHGFFSYDFFAHGVFGMQTFFYVMMVSLILISLTSFSWLLILMKRKFKGKISDDPKRSRNAIVGSVVLTAFTALVIAAILISSEQPLLIAQYVSFWLMVCLFITIQIGTLLFRNWEAHFPTLLVLICLTFYSLIYAKPFVAAGYGAVLQHFQVGGGSLAQIVGQDSGRIIISGNLLLLTPDRAFIKTTDTQVIQVVNRTNTIIQLNQRD